MQSDGFPWQPSPIRPEVLAYLLSLNSPVGFQGTDKVGSDALNSPLDLLGIVAGIQQEEGLLQLFFADLASDEARLRLAEDQLGIHQAKLAAYREDERQERRPDPPRRGQRTTEHWRGQTLPMGLRYENAAVEFWTDVVAKASIVAGAKAKSAEGGARGG